MRTRVDLALERSHEDFNLILLGFIAAEPEPLRALWELIARFPWVARNHSVPRAEVERVLFPFLMTHEADVVHYVLQALYHPDEKTRESTIDMLGLVWRANRAYPPIP